ncbi:aquaporin [Hymenobacter monticola]|uniref:Aquaporin n=1 Tax=Hymenobacter monticola TaxID=1705399 RepID=A0ABY4B6T1_9BACT|nr:aquaporin [Hymenobacter monticola]UOE34725.1 aquaporin [Hymenobacter monticola]
MAFATRMTQALRQHWRHYLVEAGGIMAFLAFSGSAAVLCHHPDSAVARALGPQEWVQRVGVGLVVGSLIAAMAYSPWGKRSGAHFNPAVTLGFWHLGHIATADALWYVLAQFAGALAAGAGMHWALAPWFDHPSIHYNTTKPIDGPHGWALALGAEVLISSMLMLGLLWSLHSARGKKWTGALAGALAGALLALFVVVEAPLSGMSLNPARTLGTAVAAGEAPHLWLYFVGPLGAMWATAEAFRRYRQRRVLAARPPRYPDNSPM